MFRTSQQQTLSEITTRIDSVPVMNGSPYHCIRLVTVTVESLLNCWTVSRRL